MRTKIKNEITLTFILKDEKILEKSFKNFKFQI